MEKANALVRMSQATPDVQDKAAVVCQRYEKLVDDSQKGINNLELLADIFQQFQDLQKAYQDYQRHQWERLANFTDYSGNKQTLHNRLAKVVEIQGSIGEGEVKLNVLAAHVTKSAQNLSPRSHEAMERAVANLRCCPF